MIRKVLVKCAWAFRRMTVYSQEIVMGLAWLAFAFFSTNAPLINTLEVEYPSIDTIFHFGFAGAGALLLVAVWKHDLFFPAWVFSSFIAVSTFVAAVGVEGIYSSILYPVTWALFAFVSITQALRHYWSDDCGA